MTQILVTVLIGSLRRESFNHKLADAIIKLAPSHFSFTKSRIDDLPLYNQDDDSQPATTVMRLKEEIQHAHALLFVTPEYNRSVPGVLKNAIDHASRPYGKNAWKGKPAGIVGASIGANGTAMAQQHLRNILAYLDVPMLGQPEVFIQAKDGLFDAAGNVEKSTKVFLQDWMNHYGEWVEKNTV